MPWPKDRVNPLAGMLCLGGQAALLIRAGTGPEAPRLPWPWLFLVLSIFLLTLILFSGGRRPGSGATGILRSTGGRFLVFLAVLQLGLSGAFVASRGPAPVSSGPSTTVEQFAAPGDLGRLGSDLDRLARWVGEEIIATSPDEDPDLDVPELFELVARISERWPVVFPGSQNFPLQAVVWKNAERAAWTPEAEPLRWPDSNGGPAPLHALMKGNNAWFLRHLMALGPGLVVEYQVELGAGIPGDPLPGWTLKMPGDQTDDDDLPGYHAVPLVENAGGSDPLIVELGAIEELPAFRLRRTRARLLLSGLMVWGVLVAAFCRTRLGTLAFVLGLWGARGVFAGAEALRWVNLAFPDTSFPASPGSFHSLMDPAYFATPFAFGWFASTGDAIMTSILVAVTAWYLLRRQGLIRFPEDPPADESNTGYRFSSAVLFGLLVGGVLLVLRGLAGILAENANPRLVGTGVSLSFLSFWGLHLTLMLVSFSLTALATGFGGRGSFPDRSGTERWLACGALGAVTAVLVALVVPEFWWGGRILAGVVAGGLWLAASAFRARPRFLRRFAWPLMVLLTASWNYMALREVYDQAERSWLERKAGVIVESDQEWTRYLLGSVVEDMLTQDRSASPLPYDAEIWRDEAAWGLWRESALRDLGLSCLVALMDPDGAEESFFAQGFLRDFQYEVASRSDWTDAGGSEPAEDAAVVFQTERRNYPGGEEEILVAEAPRSDGAGWLRVELPGRSWRLETLRSRLVGPQDAQDNVYRPRSEIDRPVMMLRADATGWLDAGPTGYPEPESDVILKQLQQEILRWGEIEAGGRRWLCMWSPLPRESTRTVGEGFLLGIQRPGLGGNLLDLSRLVLLNLVFFFVLFVSLQLLRWLSRPAGGEAGARSWLPGFQERFLAGYLLLGLVLLAMVGASVDRDRYETVRQEARSRTRTGLSLSVEQLRSLLAEQARSLANSEYIDELLGGQLAGQRPVGPVEFRQGMVFREDGTLILDETLSNLSDVEARNLLDAARNAPLVVIQDEGEVYLGTVIPITLGSGAAGSSDPQATDAGHGTSDTDGFFFYRQWSDPDLLVGLADLVHGQVTLRLGGRPFQASHPASFYEGREPLLEDPRVAVAIAEHAKGAGVFAAEGRPFAFTGVQPLPAFGRDGEGRLVASLAPAMWSVAFPDREREYTEQRRDTGLFLTGLANLILLTALLMALALSWGIFGPLRVLLTATRSLGRGDFEAPLPEPGADEVGRLAAAFGGMRSDLLTARDRLASRERFLATVLERVPVGVGVLNPDGELAALNPTGSAILEVFVPDLEPAEGLRLLQEEFGRLAEGMDRPAGEVVSRDRRVTLRGAMAPLDLPDGRTNTMVVFEDVTEFLKNQKMAINAELARQVAHEIKNPLTPIQLSIQLLDQAWRDKHPDLDRILESTVNRVLDQVTLLRSIASEFSLLGRPDELETESVDLEALVKETVGAYTGAGFEAEDSTGPSERPRIRFDSVDDASVQANRDSVVKIVGNLMQNSMDAARPGQQLEIEVRWEHDADQVTLIWMDNGSGVTAEVADRLFEPYFSTKSKGTGLGLAICRNLADRMGGGMSLENRNDGPGAVASLSLPRADSKDI